MLLKAVFPFYLAGDDEYAPLTRDEDLEFRARHPTSENLLLLHRGVLFGVYMPLVEIKWWKGRDDATKAKTIELVTKAVCEAVGCPPDAVTVIIEDIDKSSWGRGGKPSA